MAEEEYEILPHRLLSDLKEEVESLKKKLSEPDLKANELILEIESLKDLVHELNQVFTKALQEMQEEDLGKSLKIILEKLSVVGSQNETIARGMLAISDKLENFMHKQQTVSDKRSSGAPMALGAGAGNPPLSMPVKHTMGMPMPSGPARNAPFPPPPSLKENQLPPPPPANKKRVGLFR